MQKARAVLMAALVAAALVVLLGGCADLLGLGSDDGGQETSEAADDGTGDTSGDDDTGGDGGIPDGDGSGAGAGAPDGDDSGSGAEPEVSCPDAWPEALPGRVPIGTVYEEVPVPSDGDAGALRESEREAVLTEVNCVRALHGLPAVDYAPAYDNEVTAASLIISANAEMSHFPSEDLHFYSDAGADGSASSNLYIHYYPVQDEVSPSQSQIRGWLIDEAVPSLGHRRWILDPFLPAISYGRVDGPPAVGSEWQAIGGSALKVIFDEDAVLDPSLAPSFIAYPQGTYPSELVAVDWYWSFSVLADPTDRWGNDEVDFSAATVEVTGDGGPLGVTDVSYDNDGFGLPNNLQWRVTGAEVGQSYDVSVQNVVVNGESRSYAYEVLVE
jgi:hypothetical protein